MLTAPIDVTVETPSHLRGESAHYLPTTRIGVRDKMFTRAYKFDVIRRNFAGDVPQLHCTMT